ncbi:unnamed protein product [Medioppia subpectinata]|uniref:Nuclear receptor domain-containing protein n=1 Tax=Medioppia subpectinata TaxID=1979941 RepID=A0A7R9PT28_9ACAR|nr:unnamed protein product [Medioppia subpectinata]CAG2100061.1 unnamed protein product [Medioppia subpectinata]
MISRNFSAITCVSCKTIFRRNASKYESFKCYFENNCPIDVLRRRFCKKCRLKKCFDVGMKRFVNVAKHIEAFDSLCDQDQISIIKYGSIETGLLRSLLMKRIFVRDFKAYNNKFCDENIFIKILGNDWDSDRYVIDLT